MATVLEEYTKEGQRYVVRIRGQTDSMQSVSILVEDMSRNK
jgi:hypothetical protein